MQNMRSLDYHTLSTARNAVYRGEQIPAAIQAKLEAWGFNVPALEQRFIEGRELEIAKRMH